MNTNRLRYTSMAGILALCASLMLFTGCGNTDNNTSANGNNTSTSSGTGTTAGTTDSTANTPSDQQGTSSNPQTDQDQSGLPEGVTIKRIIKTVTTDYGYKKQVELLSDGGKRVTLTAPDGTRSVRYIEYDGVITAVNNKTLSIRVDHGADKTITIPEHATIDDEDAVGFNVGVEIEWTIDDAGQIESIELDRD